MNNPIDQNTEEQISEKIAESFSNVLNKNGFSFQFSALKKAKELASTGKSTFQFIVSEFPVYHQGKDTRIDFVLEKWGQYLGTSATTYLIAECKRVNPAYSNWLFVKSPNSSNDDYTYGNSSFFESLRLKSKGENQSNIYWNEVKQIRRQSNSYHLGFDVKTDKKGDIQGCLGDAIEIASTQVLRGLNGFLHTIKDNPKFTHDIPVINFVPVIFTTADLYVTNVDISAANLDTGELDLNPNDCQKVDWLYFQYPMSKSLKHSIESVNTIKDIPEMLYFDHIRTIPIVSPKGIESFLNSFSKFNLSTHF